MLSDMPLRHILIIEYIGVFQIDQVESGGLAMRRRARGAVLGTATQVPNTEAGDRNYGVTGCPSSSTPSVPMTDGNSVALPKSQLAVLQSV